MSEPVAIVEPVKSAFDLSDLKSLIPDQEAGKDLDIVHPGTGEPLGITMRIAGPDSKRVKAMQAAIIAERAEMRIRKVTAARQDEEQNRMAAASIISWSGVVENGQEIVYSPSMALTLLTRFPFMREQIAIFSGDRANFLMK